MSIGGPLSIPTREPTPSVGSGRRPWNPSRAHMTGRCAIEYNASSRAGNINSRHGWQAVVADVPCLISDRTETIDDGRGNVRSVRRHTFAFADHPGVVIDVHHRLIVEEPAPGGPVRRAYAVTAALVDHKGLGLVWSVECEDAGPIEADDD